jgi:hypothetical protein
MARGHAFWVIVTGTSATAFRARRKEDLLPTLHQLQRTQPDAVVRWFDRGKLWESPIEAREALRSKGRRPAGERRGAEWRPGGSHKDPRARFKRTRDEKREQFKRRSIRRRREEQEPGAAGAPPRRDKRPPRPQGRGRPPGRGRGPGRGRT